MKIVKVWVFDKRDFFGHHVDDQYGAPRCLYRCRVIDKLSG